MNSKLVIYTQAGVANSVGMAETIPVSITIAIADVREPDKRNSAFSKTIIIPGTQQVNRLFKHIFDVTTELSGFDPNLKSRCEYFVKDDRVFEGDIQLLRINTKGKHPIVESEYECSVVGRLANVFLDLGNAMLTDLDLSDLNHTFNYSTIATGWSSYTPGTGYVYPYIDYGVTGGNSSSWYIEHLKPAVFEKEYIDRIFDSIGKTYTSTFFGSSYHNQIVIPDVNEGQLRMTASQINAISFYVGKTVDTTFTPTMVYVSGPGVWHMNPPFTQNIQLGQLVFNDEASPYYDGGGNFSGNTFLTPVTTTYKFNAKIDFEVRINPPAGTTSTTIVNSTYTFMVEIYNATQGVPVATQSVSVSGVNTSTWTSFSVMVSLPSSQWVIGQSVYCRLVTDDQYYFATQFFNGFTPITTGTASIDVKQKVGSWFSGTSGNGQLPIGYTVAMNQTIPKNVRQIDFLMSVIKAENLYMELDPTDSNNYIIEKRSDFFIDVDPADSSTYEDWTDKWDYQRGDVIVPMGELDWREYIFTYKTDNDKFNKIYKDSYGEVYGQENILVNNDFIKNTKKNELIFAATPLAGNQANNIVAPVLAQIDGTGVKPMACQIRRLYAGGLINCAAHTLYTAVNGSGVQTQTNYFYAGHLNNPYAPTIDLCWDNPKELYYAYPGQVYTNNNLYVRNYQNFIEQITDKNSKIVIKWMYLKSSDISNFTFRKKVWIHDSWYIVNKIMEYNPQEVSLCRVEFLRLAFVADPVVEEIEIWNNGQGSTSSTQYGIIVNNGNNPNDTGGQSNSETGMNNYSFGSLSSITGGYNNYIGGITGQ